MAANESLALALSELIKRLSPEEKVELMRHIVGRNWRSGKRPRKAFLTLN